MTPSSASSGKPNSPQSVLLLRWIGYALLLLTLLDLIVVLLPPDLMNAEWEFQAAGAIVERIPVPLIGIGLIFFGETYLRKPIELVFLKFLSWLCLLASGLCLVVIPLMLATSAQRLTVQLDVDFGNQLSEQMEQTIAVEEQLSQATNEELTAFLEEQGVSLDDQTSAQAKESLIASLATVRQETSNQIQSTLGQRHLVLKKNAIKWVVGSAISAFVFAYTWWLSSWARKAFKGIWPKSSGKRQYR